MPLLTLPRCTCRVPLGGAPSLPAAAHPSLRLHRIPSRVEQRETYACSIWKHTLSMLSNSSGGKLTMNLAARSSSTPASVSVPNDDCGVAPADVWSLYDILSASIARAVESSVKRERREGEKLSQRDSGDDSPRSAVYTKAFSNRLSYSIFDPTRQIPGRWTDRDFPKWQELVNINFTRRQPLAPDLCNQWPTRPPPRSI